MIIKRFKLVLSSLVTFLTIGLSGCVSTEIIDLPVETSTGDEIMLCVSAPGNVTSRAGNDHFIRYVAKLFYADKAGTGIKFIERKELKEGDNNNIIVFKAPSINTEYTILVFADYLPEGSLPNESGFYPDCYYDTQSQNEQLTMNAFTGSDHKSKCLINNDNFDCFSDYNTFMKYEEVKEINFTLKRATAKVRFIANNSIDNFSKIEFSKFDFCDQFNQIGGTGYRSETFKNSYVSNISFSEPSDLGNNEIFYFYTLGPKAADSYLRDIQFKITGKEGDPKTTEISGGYIPIQKNFITNVKGNFIQEISNEDPNEGDIILYLSTDDTWENPDKSSNWQ